MLNLQNKKSQVQIANLQTQNNGIETNSMPLTNSNKTKFQTFLILEWSLACMEHYA